MSKNNISKDAVQEDKSPFSLNWEPKKIDPQEEHLAFLLSREECIFFPYTVGENSVMPDTCRRAIVIWCIGLMSNTTVDKDFVVHKAIRMMDMYFSNMMISLKKKSWDKPDDFTKIAQILLHISQENVGLDTTATAVNRAVITGEKYIQKDIYNTEYKLLIEEIWKNGVCSPFDVTFYDFVYMATQNSSEKQKDFAQYLTFLCLLDIELCYEIPSRVASAILNRVSKKFPKFIVEPYISEKLGSSDPEIMKKIKTLRKEDKKTEKISGYCVKRKKNEDIISKKCL